MKTKAEKVRELLDRVKLYRNQLTRHQKIVINICDAQLDTFSFVSDSHEKQLQEMKEQIREMPK